MAVRFRLHYNERFYIDLFRHLLNPFETDSLKSALPKAEQINLRASVYDELIQAIITLLNRLALQYSSVAPSEIKAEGGAASGAGAAAEQTSATVVSSGKPSPTSTSDKETSGANEVKIDEKEPEEDDEKVLQPEMPKDFEIFLNLVEFTKLILPGPKPTSKGFRLLMLMFY